MLDLALFSLKIVEGYSRETKVFGVKEKCFFSRTQIFAAYFLEGNLIAALVVEKQKYILIDPPGPSR